MNRTIHLSADLRNETAILSIISEHDKLVLLPDTMTDGPLVDIDCNLKFDQLRNKYIQSLSPQTTLINSEQKGNVETIMEVSQILSNEEADNVVYWMGGNTIDVLGYFFILHFLRGHYEKISVINIAGLPFLNEDLQLIFPTRISELNASEISKALKLARPITASEMEIDGEEWKSIRDAEGSIRILDGNKKIKTVSEDHFDTQLRSIHKQGNKLTKTVNTAIQKHQIELHPLFIEARLQQILLVTEADVDATGEQ